MAAGPCGSRDGFASTIGRSALQRFHPVALEFPGNVRGDCAGKSDTGCPIERRRQTGSVEV